MRRVLLLFVDGLGWGPDDPAVNPLVAGRTPTLDGLLGRRLAGPVARIRGNGALLLPADATLGVEGLPQSATGQTALLTGVNAAQLAGRHVAAYPTAHLREVLKAHNLFARVLRMGGRAALANAYTPEYFAAVEAGRLRHASITYAALSAGVRLRGLDDLRAGAAVFHDLTNDRPRAWGYDVPSITPRQAGRHLAGIARGHHLTLFEFFLTDLAAHGRIPLEPAAVVEMLDALLAGVLEGGDPGEMLVLMASDHGNLEDVLSVGHTRNPVPVLLIGAGREEVGASLRTITDVAPAVTAWLAGALPGGEVRHG
ncbi:MAG: metalloenzyme [Armatimonadota bacterium]|nr:metalloenzyme [Armatimonadota bacterium]MDR7452284.1 metalloenzyme [Armatimonadota bacterium]MDR7467952.1 metalloenzyme [Armatimonadota bacterium]MDR7494794.1 metalloenzyme [Armatimonadota bacterium]MDR7499251.1 metalloenzyme [Armatimonadota bacterium]